MSYQLTRSEMRSRAARALEALLATGLGILCGQMSLVIVSKPPSTGPITLVWLVRGVTTPSAALIGLFLLVCFAAYLRVGAERIAVRGDPRFLSNVLVYLAGASLLVPFLPVRVICVMALLVALLVPRTPSNRIPVGFWVVAGVGFSIWVLGGLTASVRGDLVRASIPWSVQAAGIWPYALILILTFCIIRNGWGVKEFETFFTLILLCGMLLAVDALGTFYVGRDTLLPGMAPSVRGGAAREFVGALSSNGHHVARMAMTGVFMSIYLFFRTGRRVWLALGCLSFLAEVATLGRAPILTTIAAVGILVSILGLRGARPGPAAMLSGSLVIVTTAATMALVILALVVISGIRATDAPGAALRARLLHAARTTDVLSYSPLFGTGPRLETYYTGTWEVPPRVFTWAVAELQVPWDWAVGKITEDPDEGVAAGFSSHNAWLDFVQHWGLVGGPIALAYLIYLGTAMAVKLRRLRGPRASTAWVAFLMAVSLSVSVLTTSKFGSYWFLIFTYLFAGAVVHEAAAGEDAGDRAYPP